MSVVQLPMVWFQFFNDFDRKNGVKNFGLYKNNGIWICPLFEICPLFQVKPEIMDAKKSMEFDLCKLLTRRSLVQVRLSSYCIFICWCYNYVVSNRWGDGFAGKNKKIGYQPLLDCYILLVLSVGYFYQHSNSGCCFSSYTCSMCLQI